MVTVVDISSMSHDDGAVNQLDSASKHTVATEATCATSTSTYLDNSEHSSAYACPTTPKSNMIRQRIKQLNNGGGEAEDALSKNLCKSAPASSKKRISTAWEKREALRKSSKLPPAFQFLSEETESYQKERPTSYRRWSSSRHSTASRSSEISSDEKTEDEKPVRPSWRRRRSSDISIPSDKPAVIVDYRSVLRRSAANVEQKEQKQVQEDEASTPKEGISREAEEQQQQEEACSQETCNDDSLQEDETTEQPSVENTFSINTIEFEEKGPDCTPPEDAYGDSDLEDEGSESDYSLQDASDIVKVPAIEGERVQSDEDEGIEGDYALPEDDDHNDIGRPSPATLPALREEQPLNSTSLHSTTSTIGSCSDHTVPRRQRRHSAGSLSSAGLDSFGIIKSPRSRINKFRKRLSQKRHDDHVQQSSVESIETDGSPIPPPPPPCDSSPAFQSLIASPELKAAAWKKREMLKQQGHEWEHNRKTIWDSIDATTSDTKQSIFNAPDKADAEESRNQDQVPDALRHLTW